MVKVYFLRGNLFIVGYYFLHYFLLFHFRTQNQISYAKRIKIFENWKRGCYKEIALFHRPVWFPSHLILDKEFLYTSRGGQFRAHRRTPKHYLDQIPAWSVGEIKDSEILAIAKMSETFFLGRSSGQGVIITKDSIDSQNLHSKCIDSVDLFNNIFITTNETCTKIWRKESELGMCLLDEQLKLDQSFYHLKIDNSGTRFVGGKFRDNDGKALMLVDIQT